MNILKIIALLCLSITSINALEEEITEHKNSHIIRMDLSLDRDIENIEFLAEYSSLRCLILRDCRELGENYSFVANLIGLTYLDISNICIENTNPLRSTTRLIYLNLSGNPNILTLEDVIQLTHLTSLDLSRCFGIIPDLPKLTSLTNLEKLSLNSLFIHVRNPITQISDGYASLEFLTNLPKLKNISLKYNIYLLDITPLTRVPSLIYLNIEYCKYVENISSIQFDKKVTIKK